jgi:C-terminal processing protease CtpA/Prc
MNALANTDALIVDLRNCRGGHPEMIALISSYLFDGEPVHLNSLYWREGDVTQQFWTLPYVPGQRFGDKPIFVLTGSATFSGGEEFAYNLKTRRRATLVGKITGGGAHPGAPYRLHPHFEVFVPVGRAINPITGTNWEGCGVAPDILVSEEQAFGVAYEMALESVIADLGESPTGPFRALAQEARTALKGLVTT